MYLTNNRSQTGYVGAEQRAGGLFLIAFGGCGGRMDGELADDYKIPDGNGVRILGHIWCCVRSVRMRQCGHWMMGHVDLAGFHFSLSGGFGNDGMPHNWKEMIQTGPKSEENPGGKWDHRQLKPDEVKLLKDDYLLMMPEELSTRYWRSDDGHNSVPPSVAGDIRKWAEQNLKELQRRPRRKKANSNALTDLQSKPVQ